ncbi:hypothetical protein BGZ81_007115, partial [Podila clonocystis]
GVEEVVYYSSLTHGLAGGALAIAPQDSPLKSLDLKTIISSVGKLAVEIQMAQSVARLADLDPVDPIVRAMTFLSLSADSPSDQGAQNARDLHNLINNGIAELIPESVIRALSEQAALVLITRGAGQSGTTSAFEAVPVLRNVFAFSNEVLNANNIGDVVKFVFCPKSSRVEPVEAEKVEKEGESGAQKVLKMPEEAGKKVVEEVKEGVDAAQDNTEEMAKEAAEKAAQMMKAAEAKTAEMKKAAEDKMAEEKMAAEVKAAEIKNAAEDKVNEAKEETEETAADVGQKIVDEGAKVAASVKENIDEASKMAEEASKKTQEQPKKEDAKEEL